MTNLQRKIATAIATGALFLNVVTPGFAATYEVTQNGADSSNQIDTNVTRDVDVDQNNDADIDNNIKVKANTGYNDANKNTGGDVEVDTGDALVKTTVSNVANVNHAEVDCCQNGDVDLKISENGADSYNKIDLDMDNDIDVDQDNDADFDNKVDVQADSGHNDANENTGGSVEVDTGDAKVWTAISNAANWNSARVAGSEDGGALSAEILKNGADSDNRIDIDLDNDIDLDQDNDADFYNNVDVDADTGYNDANDNTGDEVSIETGDAISTVHLDNLANFNWADITCGCLAEDLFAKVGQNGADSYNRIDIDLDDDLDVDQDNDSDFDNRLDVDTNTGDNEAEDNTDGDSHDPSVETGDAGSEVNVSNEGNANVYGPNADLELPDFNFSFDLSDLLDLLGLLGLGNQS